MDPCLDDIFYDTTLLSLEEKACLLKDAFK